LKRVVIIGPAWPLRGGIAAYTQRMAHQFVQEGHNVIIYTFSLQYPSFLFPGKTQYTNDPAPSDLKIKEAINSINPFNWIKVGNEIKKLSPDIVVFNYWLAFMGMCMGTIARIIRKNKSTAVLAVIHNMIPHEKRTGDNFLGKYFINSCSGFLTMTKKVEDDLKQFTSSSNILTSSHPVYDTYGEALSKSEAAKVLGLKEDDSYLLFFGLVRRYKGLDLLMEAMADDRIRDHNLKLLVAGEFYDDRSFYDNLAKQLNIYNNVIICSEYIPDDKVKYYFSIADMVVLPYRNATQSGVSSLAIHFDKPMIVSNFGGLPDTVSEGKTGFIVDGSSASLADAIHKYYTAADKQSITENVKQEKKKYAWSNIVKAVLQLAESRNKK
jgi:glycosyltransferase involved in cell wall biosynthesis